MTLPLNSRLSALYDTNGTQKDFSFGFRVFFDPDNGGYGLEVRRQTADGYEVIPKSDYLVLPVEDNSAGVVRFSVAPSAGQQIYIAGKTPTIQQLVLTNFGRYSAESIETQFDFITAIIQEWLSALGEETRQRIAADEILTQYVVQRIDAFVQQVNQNFDDKSQEIEDYIATIMPSFTQALREEIEAYAVAGMQDAIEQTLAESKAEIDDAVARANAAALAAAITGKVYDTPEAGVNPVTGVQNGAYYNVRSPNSDSFLIEYQNIGGVPTPSGKSYPSAAYVQNVAKHTALPFVVGKTYELHERVQLANGDVVKNTIPNNTTNPNVDLTGWVNFERNQARKVIHVLDLGMKMDGSDETAKLNEIIAILDNCRLVIGGGNLTLSKTSLYAADYPKNDQPCVPILDKTNFQIEISPDCTIHVPVHGQGAFEMMRCTGSWVINNGSIKGAGNFPPLDGTTGGAEKGTATAGYLTSPTFYKNNSLDTSANTQGGYGGNFPQWGGGTAPTWGIWNGGFIGNEGYGVLIHNGCFMCGVTGIGEIYGFNGSGVQIGFNGSYSAPSLNYPPSIACIVRGVNVHDCYHNGIQNTNSIGSLIELNTVHDIGHPNAKLTDAYYDPGYGIVTSFSIGHNAVDAVWRNNNVFNCKRKGLDLHSGVNTTMKGNTVTDCWVVGAFVAQADVSGIDTKHNKVIGNTFIRCGQAPDSNMYQSIGGVQTYALGDSVVGTEILNNTFIDCVGARGVINVDAGKNNIVRGNTIKGSNYNTTFKFTGIDAGSYSGLQSPYDTFIEDNTIELNHLMVKGITAAAGSGIIKDNTILIPDGVTQGIGIENLTSGSVWDYIGNHVTAKAGRAYIIQNTGGVSARNTETLSGTATVGDKSTSKASEALFASVQVTFNNTASPSFTVLKGSDVIDTVINDAFGFRINLKNLNATQKVFAAVERTTAEGLVTATGNANYIYTRAATYQTVVIGLQLTPASAAIEAQNVTRNNVRVDIFITN